MSIPDIEAIMDEGVEQFNLDELAAKDGDVTADDLRGVLGEKAEGISDDDLLKEYASVADDEESTDAEPDAEPAEPDTKTADAEAKPADAEAGAAVADTPASPADASVEPEPEPEPDEWNRPWAMVAEDGTQLTTAQLEAVLEAKLRYRAAGEEHDQPIDTVVREAQQTAGLRQRLDVVLEQRNAAAETQSKLEADLEALRKDQEYWNYVMADPTGDRFVKARDELQRTAFETTPAAAAEPAPVDAETISRGQARLNELRPAFAQMSTAYGPNGEAPDTATAQYLTQEIEKQFLSLCGKEGAFLTQERQIDILQNDIPYLMHRAGIMPVVQAAPAAPADPRDAEIAALKAQIANETTAATKAKLDDVPDVDGGGPPADASVAAVDFSKVRSAADVRAMLQDPNETFGL